MIDYLPATARYSLDTSSLVNGWGKHYPPDLFAPVWVHIDTLIQQQVVVASAEVMNEIRRQADDLHDWCHDRDNAFIDLIPDIQANVTTILQRYPRLVAAGRNAADPFVVGVAMLDAARVCVVTEETRIGGSERRPKMPFICDQSGISCMTFVDMLRTTGFRIP